MTESKFRLSITAAALFAALALGGASMSSRAVEAVDAKVGDYIVAVVNSELVTAAEVDQRVARMKSDAERNKTVLPADVELRKQVVETLIDERAALSKAREQINVDEADVDRAVANVAAQNQVPLSELREALKREGMDLARFRANLRDQMMVERFRDREVQSRIRVTDSEIENFLEAKRAAVEATYNIAQIVIKLPENATQNEMAEAQLLYDRARERLKAGESFAAVARSMSQDSASREAGGELGLKPVSKLPDAFVGAVKNLAVGELATKPLRTGAGLHVLKLIDKHDSGALLVTQTHARHILLRLSNQVTMDTAIRRLADFKKQITGGKALFEDLARAYSDDGSANVGGDLGWASPGMFVPEFDEAMNNLKLGEVSDPVPSRFGVHLMQVLERRDVELEAKAQRELARNALREQKREGAYAEWIKDLRSRTYIEMREPPL